MKEEWLFPGAIVSVDVETTSALVAEIKRLIDVVGGMALGMALAPPEQIDCPRCGHVCSQREWQRLTTEEVKHLYPYGRSIWGKETFEAIEKALKEKNSAN